MTDQINTDIEKTPSVASKENEVSLNVYASVLFVLSTGTTIGMMKDPMATSELMQIIGTISAGSFMFCMVDLLNKTVRALKAK